MRHSSRLLCAVLLTSCLVAVAKDKKKFLLPADIVQARTAWVIIDPHAGVDVKDPNANNIARSAVERALAKWGRLEPVADPSLADIIIVIRKGTGKVAEPTIADTPINAPPPMIGQRTDAGVDASARTGTPPPFGSPDPRSSDPHPQMEIGDTQDNFAVYRCNRMQQTTNPLNASAVWRYSATNALDSPGVPAVDQFRKVILESEKELAKP
jgi:hypothetical protein